MEIRKLKVSDINPAPYNPRKDLQPGDAEWEHIYNSIKTFGFIDPIIVNERNNVIVGGHQRYKIVKSMGYEEIDCVLVDMDEQQEKACNMALNKAQGSWDYAALDELLADVTDFDMSDFGFADLPDIDVDGFFEDAEPKEQKPEEEEEIQCPHCGMYFKV